MAQVTTEFVGTLGPTYAKESKDFFIGFEGSFGARHVTARTLTSRHINNLVCIEGIATKVTEELLLKHLLVTKQHVNSFID